MISANKLSLCVSIYLLSVYFALIYEVSGWTNYGGKKVGGGENYPMRPYAAHTAPTLLSLPCRCSHCTIGAAHPALPLLKLPDRC